MTKKTDTPAIRFKGFSDTWEQRKLNEVGVVIDPHPSHRAPKEEQGGIPFIGIGDVDEMGNINRESARPVPENVYDEHHKRYDLNVPSLGLGRVASLGKVIRLRSDIGKYAISPTISVLQFSENINIDYLYAYMNTPQFKKQFEGKSNGSTRQSVGTEMVRLLNLSMPFNLDEQKAIGTFYKNLDNLITLHQREYEKLHNIKKSMLEKMFPKNGSNVPEIRFKGFTEAWEQRKLTEFVEFFSGLTYTPNDVQENGTLVLRSSNVSNGEVVDADNVYVNPQVVNSENVKGGDIVVVVRNGSRSLIGKHAQIKAFMPNTVIGAFMTGIRSECPEFTNALLNTSRFEEEIAMNMGATINQITGYMFSKMEFKVPCLDEQKKIGEYFEKLDNLITLHQRELEKLQNIKKSMLEKMFV